MESHSATVRRLVDEFRSRSGDTRVDSGGMRRVWESLLRQVQSDAEAHLDLAAVLQQQLSRPTLEASFHRKLQSRKVIRFRSLHLRKSNEPLIAKLCSKSMECATNVAKSDLSLKEEIVVRYSQNKIRHLNVFHDVDNVRIFQRNCTWASFACFEIASSSMWSSYRVRYQGLPPKADKSCQYNCFQYFLNGFENWDLRSIQSCTQCRFEASRWYHQTYVLPQPNQNLIQIFHS